jgi:hypothetical protein
MIMRTVCLRQCCLSKRHVCKQYLLLPILSLPDERRREGHVVRQGEVVLEVWILTKMSSAKVGNSKELNLCTARNAVSSLEGTFEVFIKSLRKPANLRSLESQTLDMNIDSPCHY